MPLLSDGIVKGKASLTNDRHNWWKEKSKTMFYLLNAPKVDCESKIEQVYHELYKQTVITYIQVINACIQYYWIVTQQMQCILQYIPWPKQQGMYHISSNPTICSPIAKPSGSKLPVFSNFWPFISYFLYLSTILKSYPFEVKSTTQKA